MFRRNTIKDGDLIAAVDLGSNSFHMIVARYEGGELKTVDRIRDMVRLAAGMNGERLIADDAKARALTCLAQFGQRLRNIPTPHVRIVGTNTLRRANNAEGFLLEAEQAVGHPIQIIAGIEEARLIYLGVAHSLANDGKRRLVMDIGGGSTELIIGERFEPAYMESLEMGCVTMSNRYFEDGNITRKRVNKALMAAQMELEPYVGYYRARGWEEAVGASGTIRAVERVVRAFGWSEYGITLESLHKLADELVRVGRTEQLKFEGLSARRQTVFAGGAMILLATFEALGIERMRVSDGALREGLLYDLIGRGRHEDVRERTVENLINRLSIDRHHALQVEACALELFDQVAESWQVNDEDTRNLLSWASRLHEIGLTISHTGYHKHGAYILENADMPGFSRQEQQTLALLVRAHQRKLSTASAKQFSEQRQQVLSRLTILLRLAVLLLRSRHPEQLPEIEAQVEGERTLRLQFPPEWLATHPLSLADLDQESEYLGGAGYRLTYT